jgi:hypothetical protein
LRFLVELVEIWLSSDYIVVLACFVFAKTTVSIVLETPTIHPSAPFIKLGLSDRHDNQSDKRELLLDNPYIVIENVMDGGEPLTTYFLCDSIAISSFITQPKFWP